MRILFQIKSINLHPLLFQSSTMFGWLLNTAFSHSYFHHFYSFWTVHRFRSCPIVWPMFTTTCFFMFSPIQINSIFVVLVCFDFGSGINCEIKDSNSSDKFCWFDVSWLGLVIWQREWENTCGIFRDLGEKNFFKWQFVCLLVG